MKQLPVVRGGEVIIEGAASPIGSAAWAGFLATSPSFRYEQGEESITVRRDRGDLWSAYKKYQGKLYRAYVGSLSDKTPNEVTSQLSGAMAAMREAHTKDVEAGEFANKRSELQKLREENEDFKRTIKSLNEYIDSLKSTQPGERLTAIAS